MCISQMKIQPSRPTNEQLFTDRLLTQLCGHREIPRNDPSIKFDMTANLLKKAVCALDYHAELHAFGIEEAITAAQKKLRRPDLKVLSAFLGKMANPEALGNLPLTDEVKDVLYFMVNHPHLRQSIARQTVEMLGSPIKTCYERPSVSAMRAMNQLRESVYRD